MTREEALRRLEQNLSIMKFVDDVFADCVDGEALEIAVEALRESGGQEVKHAPVIRRERHIYCIKGAAVDIHGEPYLKKAPYTYIQEICPLCGTTLTGEWNNYCDKCGAKMDKEEEEK